MNYFIIPAQCRYSFFDRVEAMRDKPVNYFLIRKNSWWVGSGLLWIKLVRRVGRMRTASSGTRQASDHPLYLYFPKACVTALYRFHRKNRTSTKIGLHEFFFGHIRQSVVLYNFLDVSMIYDWIYGTSFVQGNHKTSIFFTCKTILSLFKLSFTTTERTTETLLGISSLQLLANWSNLRADLPRRGLVSIFLEHGLPLSWIRDSFHCYP